MLTVQIETLSDLAVVECKGRIVRSDAAFKLSEAVFSHGDARIIVLDLSEVAALEGHGLGMLLFLQRWADDHDIRLRMFNPRPSVRARLEYVSPIRGFDIATLAEMTALLARADSRFARTA